jgi:TonB family protein
LAARLVVCFVPALMVSAVMGMPQPAGTLAIGVCFLFLFDWKRLWVAFVCTAPWTLLLLGVSDDNGNVDLATRLDQFLLSPAEHKLPIDTTREALPQEIPSPRAASQNLTTDSNPEQESLSPKIPPSNNEPQSPNSQSTDEPRADATKPPPKSESKPLSETREAALRNWRKLVSEQIRQHSFYPQSSRYRNEDGTVLVLLTIGLDDGHLIDSKIITSSGFDHLDRAAQTIVAKSAPFPPLDIAGLRVATIQVPIVFKLSEASPTAASPSSGDKGASANPAPTSPTLPPQQGIRKADLLEGQRQFREGMASFDRGDYDEAVRWLESAIRLNPADEASARALQAVKAAQAKAVNDIQLR